MLSTTSEALLTVVPETVVTIQQGLPQSVCCQLASLPEAL